MAVYSMASADEPPKYSTLRACLPPQNGKPPQTFNWYKMYWLTKKASRRLDLAAPVGGSTVCRHCCIGRAERRLCACVVGEGVRTSKAFLALLWPLRRVLWRVTVASRAHGAIFGAFGAASGFGRSSPVAPRLVYLHWLRMRHGLSLRTSAACDFSSASLYAHTREVA